MAAGGHFVFFRFAPKSIGFFLSSSSMAVSNMNLIRALVSQLCETQALACGGGGGDGVRTKTMINFKFRGYNNSRVSRTFNHVAPKYWLSLLEAVNL